MVKTLQNKLFQYNKLSVHNTGGNKDIKSSKMKSTLMAIAPFAACALMMPSAVTGQSFDPTGGANGNGALDVDGDGVVDFEFNFNTNSGGDLFVTPVGTMSVAVTNYGSASFIPQNVDVGPGPDFPNWTNTGSHTNSNNFYVDEGAGNCHYIAIRVPSGGGHLYGFVHIVKDGFGGLAIDFGNTDISSVVDATVTTPTLVPGECEAISMALLPVDFIHFSAQLFGDVVSLDWATASERNNHGFEIQRSTNGVNFTKIGWVDGEGNSDREVRYQFSDNELLGNMKYYYRLKQMDFDGASSFSTITVVKKNAIQDKISITPNPVLSGNDLTILINAIGSKTGMLHLFDISGQELIQQELSTIKGDNLIELPVSQLSSGSYIVKVVLDGSPTYQKIVIQ